MRPVLGTLAFVMLLLAFAACGGGGGGEPDAGEGTPIDAQEAATDARVTDAAITDAASTDAAVPDGGPGADCGNGVTEAGEDCDDSNETTEACDYGDTACTVCDSTCHDAAGATSYCGDNTTDTGNGEDCDDDNTTTEECAYGQTACLVCDSTCQEVAGDTSYCGDDNTDITNGETCDDDNTVTETCSYGQVSCTVCDAGCDEAAGATSYCGDGDTDGTNGETCDDDNAITEDCPYGDLSCTVCSSACVTGAGVTSYCGDGDIDGSNGETCDDDNSITDACAYGQTSCSVCTSSCVTGGGVASYCGDGAVDATNGEQCDDSNSFDDDGCESDCTFICGGDTTASAAFQTSVGCVLRHDTATSWTAASAICAAENAELATVLSAAQDAVLDSVAVGNTWMGLNDATTEGVYAWQSGVPVPFTNWADDEPNDSGGDEDCAHFRTDGQWNDLACTEELPFLCLQPSCGDSGADAGETCDDGGRITESCAYGQASCSVCDATCQSVAGDTSFCSDTVTDFPDGETCDDGNTTTEACNYGQTSCTVCDSACHGAPGATSYCSDGAIDSANGETCDDSNAITESCAYGQASCSVCTSSCVTGAGIPTFCGDSAVDASNGEVCDDGNAFRFDTCNACTTAYTVADTGTIAVAVTDNAYNGAQASMSCIDVPAAAGTNLVTDTWVRIAMSHTWVGDLVIKVISPASTVVTVMSRPGLVETADTGVGCCGDDANLATGFPITYAASGGSSAETMGNTLATSAGIVCQEDGRCDYIPNAGIATPGTLAAFNGQAATGTWRVCVGDAEAGDLGTITRVVLGLSTI